MIKDWPLSKHNHKKRKVTKQYNINISSLFSLFSQRTIIFYIDVLHANKILNVIVLIDKKKAEMEKRNGIKYLINNYR